MFNKINDPYKLNTKIIITLAAAAEGSGSGGSSPEPSLSSADEEVATETTVTSVDESDSVDMSSWVTAGCVCCTENY